MSTSETKAELLELYNRLVNHQFTDEDRERLEALVLNDPELRSLYVEMMHLNASLHQSASRISDRPLEEVILPFDAEPHPKARRTMPRWPLQIAAALAIGFAAWWLVPRPSKMPIARLVET